MEELSQQSSSSRLPARSCDGRDDDFEDQLEVDRQTQKALSELAGYNFTPLLLLQGPHHPRRTWEDVKNALCTPDPKFESGDSRELKIGEKGFPLPIERDSNWLELFKDDALEKGLWSRRDHLLGTPDIS